MKSMFTILSLMFAFTVCANAQTINSDEIPKGLVIEDLAGEYKNTNGDTVLIEVTNEPSDDLFRKEYSVYLNLKFADLSRDFEIDFSGITENEDGTYSIFKMLECQDPGCEEYELDMTITKANDGSYSLSANVDYTKLIDDEGPAESDEQAKAMCSWLVGKKDVIDVTWDENGTTCAFLGSAENLVK